MERSGSVLSLQKVTLTFIMQQYRHIISRSIRTHLSRLKHKNKKPWAALHQFIAFTYEKRKLDLFFWVHKIFFKLFFNKKNVYFQKKHAYLKKYLMNSLIFLFKKHEKLKVRTTGPFLYMQNSVNSILKKLFSS